MKLIAHRGNFRGKNLERENTLPYIKEALANNFDCEIDIWLYNSELYLGHEEPKIQLLISDCNFIVNNFDKLWIHCKTPETLSYLLSKDYNLNLFYHNSDDCVLTSKRKIWTFPNKTLTESSVMVKFSKIAKEDLMKNIYGICGDDFSLVF